LSDRSNVAKNRSDISIVATKGHDGEPIRRALLRAKTVARFGCHLAVIRGAIDVTNLE
jgi:hypothetical protein